MGASAGGLEAFTAVLRSLPADTGMAFVLIQHLDPKHESMLVDLLAKTTRNAGGAGARRCFRASESDLCDPAEHQPGDRERRFAADGATRGPGVKMPVDIFFRSLAEDRERMRHRRHSLRHQFGWRARHRGGKGAGGITFAQDQSAKYDGMPRAAVATGCVDFVLPPDGIARELARIARHPYVRPEAGRGGRAPAWSRSRASRCPASSRCCAPPLPSISASTRTPRSAAASRGGWRFTRSTSWRNTLPLLEHNPDRDRGRSTAKF